MSTTTVRTLAVVSVFALVISLGVASLVRVGTDGPVSEQTMGSPLQAQWTDDVGIDFVPASIADLLTVSHIVVIGEYGSAIAEGTIVLPTDEDMTPAATDDPSSIWSEYSDPITDYPFTPSEILLNDGTGNVQLNSPFTLRYGGHESDVASPMHASLGWPLLGREYMLFVGRNEWEGDGKTYSNLAPWFMLLIDDHAIQYADGTPVDFASGMTRSEFIEAVEDAISTL